MVEDIREFTLAELEAKFKGLGIEPYRARQAFGWLYKKGAEDFSAMANLSKDIKEKIAEFFYIGKLGIEKIETSRDLTQKFLFRLKDDAVIESVSIPFKSRVTACISTQVGCKFSCAFCASGMLGFRRNLSCGEIIAQFIAVSKNVPSRISNVVFMGIGEPLDNYDSLMRAIRLMNAEAGIKLGARKMTISTAGFVPGIERLSKEGIQVELSVSLHAATDQKRSELMPINRRFPVKPLFAAIRNYYKATKRKVTFEYVLLGGFNTEVADAQSLIKLLRGLNAQVNLIPYNPVVSRMGFQAPSKLEVLFFKSYLTKNGIEATVRMPRGTDISAACGQLAWSQRKAEKRGEDGS